MNTIARMLTIGFFISLLAIGIAGFGGPRLKSAPVILALDGLRDNCAAAVQSITALADEATDPVLTQPCYSVIDFPYPLTYGPESLRMF